MDASDYLDLDRSIFLGILILPDKNLFGVLGGIILIIMNNYYCAAG